MFKKLLLLFLISQCTAKAQVGQQTDLAAHVKFAGVAGCNQSTASSTTLGNFSTTAACPAPTVVSSTVSVSATDTDRVTRVTINSMPSGKYIFVVNYTMEVANSTTLHFALTDDGGTVARGNINQQINADEVNISQALTLTANYNYTTTATRTFDLLFSSSNPTTILLRNDSTVDTSGGGNSPGTTNWYIYRFHTRNTR